MVKNSNKWKDSSDMMCGNGDEELNIEVEGEETRAMRGTFCG